MTDEKRVILIKPGDVLLIGGVQFDNVGQDAEAMHRFQEITGIRPVVFFADDIQIDVLAAEQAPRRRLVTEGLLAEVADVYRKALHAGDPPTRAVEKHFATTHSTAARWVREARRAGVLGKSQGPKAGEATAYPASTA